jgi:hypothetical protein
MTDLRDLVAGVPDAEPVRDLGAAIADSVDYLGSDAALASIAIDPYWPKWDSPWWHMLVLHELGEAQQIPARAVTALVDRLDALPLKFFPFSQDEAPGAELWRDTACHCALGNIYQALAAAGVDVDARLPWIKPWFLRYQMADGGLNCDETAYLVKGECPSSMVGTIAPFEAMQLGTWTAEQRAFLDRAASCLIERQLMQGSSTAHNARERDGAPRWLAPCFPRLYFYDVLRGLAALVGWAERSGAAIPRAAIAGVVEHLAAAFPDGAIRVQRHGFEICPTTRNPGQAGAGRQPTSQFELLRAAGEIGAPSPTATRQWTAARRGLLRLFDAGQIVD